MNENSENTEILVIFREETQEHLQQASDCLLRLESAPGQEDVNSLLRALHTIKGNALMLDFGKIGTLVHTCESVISKVRSGTIQMTKQLVDITFLVLDTVKSLLESDEVDGVDALISGLKAISEEVVSPQALMHQKTKSAALMPVMEAVSPEIDETQVLPAAQPETPKNGDASIFHPDKLSILVVEDDFLTRKIMVQLLRRYGTCDIAIDGEEALVAYTQSLAEKPYDIVFLDILMPKKDGFETAKGIRALEMQEAVRRISSSGASGRPSTVYEKQGTIIVMTSTLDDPEHYLNACYRCGADTYIVKPVDAGMLSEIFSRYNWELRSAT